MKYLPMKYRFSTGKRPMKGGTHYIIDPCYLLQTDPFWGDFCEYCFKEDGRAEVYIEMDGHTIYTFSTAYGDGQYPVHENGENIGFAGVDAGLLSVFPRALINHNPLVVQTAEEDGVEIELPEMWEPNYEEGNLYIPDYAVYTNDDEEEDEF